MRSTCSRINRALIALATVALTSTARAQTGVAGKWIAEYEVGLRIMNGEASSEGKGHARITFEMKKDSVFGTWQVIDPKRDPMPQPRTLHGVMKGDALIIETAPEDRTVNMGGGERDIKMFTRYELKVQGDALVGTQRGIAADASFDGPPRPFKATREKA